MTILAKRPDKIYQPCPEGLHHAVCVDVVDLGIVNSAFGDKHKVRIIWQIEEENAVTRRPFQAQKQYNLSLHDKATLRKDLESWRGRKFSEVELQGFDLEKLIGANGQIQVVQDISDEGNIWANVQAIVPAPKNTPKLVPIDYTRVKDRPSEHRNVDPAQDDDNDEIPF